MTNEEFLREVLDSPGCPDNFEELYAYFCKFQKLTLDTLREFVRVCNKNQIQYQLAFGSLLGAIRDGGQIPWDYDVDIVVPISERERLIDALDRDLDKGYHAFIPGRDRNYRPLIIRIAPVGFPHQMLHVDVFYVLGIPDEEPLRTRYYNKVKDLFYAHKYTVQDLKEYSYSTKSKIKQTALKVFYLIKYGKRAKADNYDFFSQYDIHDVKDATVLAFTVDKLIFPSSIFTNSTEIETREGVFSIPKDYETFFKVRYGDWKKYFPVENRVKEVLKHCRDFKWYQSKYNIEV